MRRSVTAVLLAATVALSGCGDGTDGVLDSREDYVKRTIEAQTLQLRDRAEGHARDIEDYANCMYDVIEANLEELESVKESDAAVSRIIDEHDDECRAALTEAVGP